jgi:hypothetical protein
MKNGAPEAENCLMYLTVSPPITSEVWVPL